MSDITKVQPGDYIKIKQDHFIVSVVSVSSEVAERWLEHNTHNRPISESGVLRWNRDMEAGRWKLAGDPIRFSKTGVLLDGQNRLMALAQCVPSRTFEFVVERGLDDEVQAVMDLGNKRTTGQQLGLLGQKNSRQVAALVRLLLVWEQGLLYDTKLSRGISTPEIEQWCADNHKLVELFIRHLAKVTRSVGATPSAAGAFAIEALRADTPGAIAFFHLLKSLANLPEGSPLLALDARLRRIRAERFKLSQRDELALFIQAWNFWMAGGSTAKLQSAKGGWSARTFPKMRVRRSSGFDTDQLARGLELAGVEQ